MLLPLLLNNLMQASQGGGIRVRNRIPEFRNIVEDKLQHEDEIILFVIQQYENDNVAWRHNWKLTQDIRVVARIGTSPTL